MKRSTPARLLLWTTVLLVVGFWSLVGLALAWDGWVGIRVESVADSATSFHLVIPAAVADAACHAMAFAGVRDLHFSPDAARVLPLASSVVTAIAGASDGVLVAVDAQGQRVTVEKRSGSFRVHVATAQGQKIEVVVPTRAVRHLLGAVTRLANLH